MARTQSSERIAYRTRVGRREVFITGGRGWRGGLAYSTGESVAGQLDTRHGTRDTRNGFSCLVSHVSCLFMRRAIISERKACYARPRLVPTRPIPLRTGL